MFLLPIEARGRGCCHHNYLLVLQAFLRKNKAHAVALEPRYETGPECRRGVLHLTTRARSASRLQNQERHPGLSCFCFSARACITAQRWKGLTSAASIDAVTTANSAESLALVAAPEFSAGSKEERNDANVATQLAAGGPNSAVESLVAQSNHLGLAKARKAIQGADGHTSSNPVKAGKTRLEMIISGSTGRGQEEGKEGEEEGEKGHR